MSKQVLDVKRLSRLKRTILLWNPVSKKYNKAIMILTYLPFLLLSGWIFVISCANYFSTNHIAAVTPLIAFFLLIFIGVLVLRGEDSHASLLLVVTLCGFGIYTIWRWGLIHPIGIMLCLLGARVSFVILSEKTARYLSLIIFLTIAFIGVIHVVGFVSYNYNWSPELSFLDFLTIHILVSLFMIIMWVNSIGLKRSLDRITKMKNLLYTKNISLQKDIVEKTKISLQDRLELDRSNSELQSTYLLLEDSEADRFRKMNLLGHYGLVVSGVLHEMVGPIMLVMAKVKEVDFGGKKDVMSSLEQLSSMLQSVRASVKMSGMDKKSSLKESIDTASEVLKWRLEKEKIAFKVILKGGESMIEKDGDKFHQIILNLINNAIDSVSKSRIKKIIITLKEVGGKGYIRIENSGKAVAKTDVSHIFDIFYSTKPEGSGIGLFLSRSYARDLFDGDIILSKNVAGNVVFRFSFNLS